MSDKQADLAGPGIGNYDDLAKVLPDDYLSFLTPRETMQALFAAKQYIEEHLAEELNLMMVQVPLIVDVDSGVNDDLDRDGSRTPIGFHISNDHDQHPIDAQIVQAATKWKRVALEQFGMQPGEGLLTDMKAVRKDYFLDHDHSAYVDQWDWEKAITAGSAQPRLPDRNGAQDLESHQRRRAARHGDVPGAAHGPKYPDLPDELTFLHAEDILGMYPDLPRKQRETEVLQKFPGVFIYGIGWTLEDGYPHEMRAADYDDWITPTVSDDGRADARSQR